MPAWRVHNDYRTAAFSNLAPFRGKDSHARANDGVTECHAPKTSMEKEAGADGVCSHGVPCPCYLSILLENFLLIFFLGCLSALTRFLCNPLEAD